MPGDGIAGIGGTLNVSVPAAVTRSVKNSSREKPGKELRSEKHCLEKIRPGS